MTDYVSFYLNNTNDPIPFECIEMDHPSFATPYRFVMNAADGVRAGGNWYEYKPMQIEKSNVTNDLDQKFSITLEDLDDKLFSAFNAIPFDSDVSPSFRYRMFREDMLDEALIEVQTLEVASFSKDAQGLLTFDAEAPVLNSSKTGKVYSVEDYPLLQGVQ